MAAKLEKIHFESVEELLGSSNQKEGVSYIKINKIYPFENHPFKVCDDSHMQELVESIQLNGVLVPVLLRPDDEGTYEMISGHRRMHAAKIAGLNVLPAIVKEMTNDEATIAMVDANVQREEILPSERAFSLKMKLEAIRHQGMRTDLSLGHNDPRLSEGCEMDSLGHSGPRWSHDDLAKEAGISPRQVKRFIRLTELIPDLLDMVDQNQLGLVHAVDISFFNKDMQHWILEYIRENGKINTAQINALKMLENKDAITQYTMIQILNSALEKKDEGNRISFSKKRLDYYFPAEYTQKQREEIIIDLLKQWKVGMEEKDV